MATHPELVAAGWDITDFEVYAPDGGDYVLQPTDTCMTTEMESGYRRKRRTQSTYFDESKILWLIPDTQIRLFRIWFAYETNHGQKWFSLNLTTGYEIGGCSPEPRQCQFVKPPTYTRFGDTWQVEAELRIIGDNGTRVRTDNTLEPLPARNAWDDTCTWEETL